MHIVDGVLPNEIIIGGAVLAAGGIAVGLRQLSLEKLPLTGVLTAAFFVASAIQFPIGPTSVHLILNGVAGVVLGWTVFPALFVGLLLQAVFFGFGGLTVLGVNTVNIALPAVLGYYLVRHRMAQGADTPRRAAIWGGIGGGLTVGLTAFLVAFSLYLSGEAFWVAAEVEFLSHIPIMVIEGFVTAAAVYLVFQVKPEILNLGLSGARS